MGIQEDSGSPWRPAKLNDEFLFRHDATFSGPTLRLLEEWTFAQPETERYIEQIRAFLSRCPQGPPLLIKDARIITLFDFWRQAALAAQTTLAAAGRAWRNTALISVPFRSRLIPS